MQLRGNYRNINETIAYKKPDKRVCGLSSSVVKHWRIDPILLISKYAVWQILSTMKNILVGRGKLVSSWILIMPSAGQGQS